MHRLSPIDGRRARSLRSLLMFGAVVGLAVAGFANGAPAPKLIAVAEPDVTVIGEQAHAKLAAELQPQLVANFVKTRKFAVLDRSFGAEVQTEKRAADPDRSEAGRVSRLGGEATAELLATAVYRRFGTSVAEGPAALPGRSIKRFRHEIVVTFQIVDVTSRRVLFADTLEETAMGVASATAGAFEIWAQGAIARLASRTVAAVGEQVYPLKVVALLANGEVVLNEGEGRVVVGDEFEVFAVGAALVDPDTGVELGREENRIGRVRIVRVLPKAAYALVEGTPAAPIPVGAVCRKAKEAPAGKKTEQVDAFKARKAQLEQDM
jgi:hypothetical protein